MLVGGVYREGEDVDKETTTERGGGVGGGGGGGARVCDGAERDAVAEETKAAWVEEMMLLAAASLYL